jgi:hypothetical protein
LKRNYICGNENKKGSIPLVKVNPKKYSYNDLGLNLSVNFLASPFVAVMLWAKISARDFVN